MQSANPTSPASPEKAPGDQANFVQTIDRPSFLTYVNTAGSGFGTMAPRPRLTKNCLHQGLALVSDLFKISQDTFKLLGNATAPKTTPLTLAPVSAPQESHMRMT